MVRGHGPGSVESLAALHASVPAAEALDLSEQAEVDRLAQDFADVMALALGPVAVAQRPGDQSAATDDAGPAWAGAEPQTDALSLGQVLGLLEHTLGAVEVDE